MAWLLKRKESTPPPSSGGTPPNDTHPVLDALPSADRAAIVAGATTRRFDQEHPLAEMGDPAADTLLILSGKLELVDRSGPVHRRVALMSAGDAVGGVTHPPDATHPAAAVGLSPGRALQVGPELISALSEEGQVAFYQALHGAESRRGAAMASRQAELAARERRLADQVQALVTQRQAVCANSEMVQKIVDGVPRLPVFATQIASMLQDTTTNTSEIVELAKLDTSLATEVIKTINSPYYNLSNKITDLQHAVVLLGFEQVYQLVMASGLSGTMPDTPAFRELQLHMNVVSFSAMETARLCDFEKPATLATVGLLHDIGDSVVLLLKEKFAHLAAFIDMLDGAKLGGMLLAKWQIPERICETVVYQNHPHFMPPEALPESCRRDVAALYLSHLACDMVEGVPEDKLNAAFMPEYAALLGLSAETPEQLVHRLILPAIRGRSQNFPEHVRRFFS
ncbi:MAG: HDOD domain-containing protein [Leptospirillia bacterium]